MLEASSSGEPADTSPGFVNEYNRMLVDEGSVPSDREEKENSEAAQQAFFGEPADEGEGFQIMPRATKTAGDAAVMYGPSVVDQPDPEASVSWTWEDICLSG